MASWENNASSGLSILQGEMCDAFTNTAKEYKNKCHTNSKTYFRRWVQMRFLQKMANINDTGKKQLKKCRVRLVNPTRGNVCCIYECPKNNKRISVITAEKPVSSCD